MTGIEFEDGILAVTDSLGFTRRYAGVPAPVAAALRRLIQDSYPAIRRG